MSTLKRLHTQAKSRRQGRPAFTLLELIVVLLVLGILAAIAVPTFNRVKENSVERVAQTTLEAIDRNGEAIAISDPDLSDAQVAQAALDEVDTPEGMTITRDGAEVTVELTRGSISASGKVTFSSGIGTIDDADSTSGGSSSTTSTTAAPTTTTTIAPVVYNVGDTGPGGGVIFAVFSTPFACGPTMNLTCTYLEVAPNGWNGGADPFRAWSGSSGTEVGTNTGLGYGYQNTLAAVAQSSTADRAITLTDTYANNGQTDWFLPSLDELHELCKYARQQATGNTSVVCTGSGPLREGFVSDTYWSSSEPAFSPETRVWRQDFSSSAGYQTSTNSKPNVDLVRPIRAG